MLDVGTHITIEWCITRSFPLSPSSPFPLFPGVLAFVKNTNLAKRDENILESPLPFEEDGEGGEGIKRKERNKKKRKRNQLATNRIQYALRDSVAHDELELVLEGRGKRDKGENAFLGCCLL